MAKCTVTEIKPAPPPKEYVLTLNEEEHKYLRNLTGSQPPEEPNYSIYKALDCPKKA